MQTDKKGRPGDSPYYDYGRCAPTGLNNVFNRVNVIAQQMRSIISRDSNPNGRGYADAEREANRRSDKKFKDEQNERRATVK